MHRPELAPDGEQICMVCGVVLDGHREQTQQQQQQQLSAPTTTMPASKINIFVARKLGGNAITDLPNLSNPTHSLEIISRHHKDKKDAKRFLSNFSNVCSKLELSQSATEHAWQLFEKLFKELGNETRIYHSELICYAIASGAAMSSRLINERTLAEIVTFVFGSKVVRDMYYIKRIIETRVDIPVDVRPELTQSARWVRGRYYWLRARVCIMRTEEGGKKYL